MCGSLADIHSTTAEIRRGKKEERKKEETTGQKYNGLQVRKKWYTAAGQQGLEALSAALQ